MMFFIFLFGILACGGGESAESLAPELKSSGPVQKSEKVEIKITIEEYGGGTGVLGAVYGDQYFGMQQVIFDANGMATISQAEPFLQGLYFLQLPENQGVLQFLLGPDQEFSLTTNFDRPILDMKVEGSVDNENFYKHLAYQEEYQKQFREISTRLRQLEKGSSEYKRIEKERDDLIESRRKRIATYDEIAPGSLFADFIQSGQSPKIQRPLKSDGTVDKVKQAYLFREEYWDGFDFTNSRLLRTPVYHNKLSEYIEEITPQNADSLIKYADWITRQSLANDSLFKYTANWIGVKYKEPEFMGGDAVYVHMVQNFFTQDRAFWSSEGEIRQLQYDAAIRKKSLPGAKAKNLIATTASGQQFNLYEEEKPYKVMYFYSITCENCRKETPKLVKFYNEWKNKGVEVIAVSIDDDEQGWRNYIKKNNMAWVNIFDPNYESNYNMNYHLDITPEMYLLNEENIIIGKDLKTFQVEELLKKEGL